MISFGRKAVILEPEELRREIAEATLRTPMWLVTYRLKPNQFHWALWPLEDVDVSPGCPGYRRLICTAAEVMIIRKAPGGSDGSATSLSSRMTTRSLASA